MIWENTLFHQSDKHSLSLKKRKATKNTQFLQQHKTTGRSDLLTQRSKMMTASPSSLCLLKPTKMTAVVLFPHSSPTPTLYLKKNTWCIGITGSLLVFYLVATGTDKEPAIFAAAVVIGRLCGGISVSFTQCLSLVFKCLKDSFQHSRLLFRMKATVESFRFACSCGYPTSYKHGDFLPRFPLLNQVEAWHPSQLWPLRALMLQLCLVLLTTHCSEIAFLLLRPQQATSTLSQLGACQHAPLGSRAFFFFARFQKQPHFH